MHLAVATLTGLDDGISQAVGDPDVRPFRTKPVESTFGVGGNVLPTTTKPVAPTSPPVQPVALQARAPAFEANAAAHDAPRSVVDTDPVVTTDVTDPVTPQTDARKPAQHEAAAQPDADAGPDTTNGDNAPKRAKDGKTGLHRVTRHDRHESARTATRSAEGSDSVAPKDHRTQAPDQAR